MRCAAAAVAYSRRENRLMEEYGMWMLEWTDTVFGVTLREEYGFGHKRLQRFFDESRGGLTKMVADYTPERVYEDNGKGRRKGDSSDLIDDGVDTTEYMIKRELRNIGFSDCDFEALSPENRYNESERHTQLDVMSHNVRTAWYEANARRAVRLYAAYTLLYMHDTYNYGAERLNRLYALVAPQIKSYVERFLIGSRRVDRELHKELDEMHGKLEKCGLHLEEVVKEDVVAVSRKEPPKEPKNPPINLDIGEYEKIMKEVARVAHKEIHMNFKLKAGAFAPIRAHKQDAGVDLLSPVTVTIYPGDSATIDTGVCAEIPEGFCGQIWSKSGLNVNHGILSTGIVDALYSGSIKIKLYNHSHEFYTVNRGDKISQLVVTPCDTSDVVIVDEIASGERGENGFGSTGR